MKYNVPALGTALSSLLVFFTTPPSYALEWSASPAITMGAEYNDNMSFSADTPDSVWGIKVTPQLTLGSSTQTWMLNGHAQITRAEYPEHSERNRTDHLLDLTWQRKGERSNWSLQGSSVRDTTLETELDVTGIVLARVPRSSTSLTPSLTYLVTETDQMSLSYGYNNTRYDAPPDTNLLDYTTQSPGASLTHTFSEKNQLTLSFGYSDYKTGGSPTISTSSYHYQTSSAQFGFMHVFSGTLRGTFTAGARKTDSAIEYLECGPGCLFLIPRTIEASSTGSLFNISLDKTFESATLSADLTRSVTPTGNGGVVQNDHLSLDYRIPMTEKLTGSLTANVYDARSVGDTSNTSNRHYSLRPRLSWRMTEQWTLSTSYLRSTQQVSDGDSTTNNAMYLTVDHNWPKISVSR